MNQNTQSTKDTKGNVDLTTKFLNTAVKPDLEDGVYTMTHVGKPLMEYVKTKNSSEDSLVLKTSWRINNHTYSTTSRDIFFIELMFKALRTQLGIQYQAGHTYGSILKACETCEIKGIVSSNDKGYVNINFAVETA